MFLLGDFSKLYPWSASSIHICKIKASLVFLSVTVIYDRIPTSCVWLELPNQDNGWLIWTGEIVQRLPVSPETTFLNFIPKLKGCIRRVNGKLSEQKEQEKVGWGEKLKTYSQGCLWSLRSVSIVWIRELRDKHWQPSHHWRGTDWTTSGIFRAASTSYSGKLPH